MTDKDKKDLGVETGKPVVTYAMGGSGPPPPPPSPPEPPAPLEKSKP